MVILSLQQFRQVMSSPISDSDAHLASGGCPHSSKADEICRVLAQPNVDLWRLRELALTDGGLVNDSLRRRAWPKLVGLQDVWDVEEKPGSSPKSAVDEASVASSHDYIAATTATTTKGARSGSGGLPPLSQQKSQQQSRHVTLDLFLETKPSGGSSSAADCDNTAGSGGPKTARSSASKEPPILCSSRDYNQVDLDVGRCTWHLLTGTQRAQRLQMEHVRQKRVAKLIRRKQRRLANLINYTLVHSYANERNNQNNNNNDSIAKQQRQQQPRQRDRSMRYYQGYHDVACIFLSTLGGSNSIRIRPCCLFPSSSLLSSSSQGADDDNDSAAAAAAEKVRSQAVAMGLELASGVLFRISQSHLADCLGADFLQLQTALRLVLMPLMCFLDYQVHDHLWKCHMEPYFALSWVITWFAHEIRDTDLVKRLFDAFIVSHPLFPIYLSVAMVLHPSNRLEVLQTECDFSEVHQTLVSLPKNSSMVGWKYRPGDGYVSDDEDDDDDENTVGTDASISEVVLETTQGGKYGANSAAAAAAAAAANAGTGGTASSSTFVVVDMDDSSKTSPTANTSTIGRGGAAHGPSGTSTAPPTIDTQSMVSSSGLSSLEPPARVPFQELIDAAVDYMRRVPPKKLLGLAVKYYGKDSVDQQLRAAPGIGLFTPPPPWSVACTTKSDWVLRQEARKMDRASGGGGSANIIGTTPSSSSSVASSSTTRSRRRDRKRDKKRSRSNSLSRRQQSMMDAATPSGPQQQEDALSNDMVAIEAYLKQNKGTAAVIAAGFGAGDSDDYERAKRIAWRRKWTRAGIAVAVVAVAVGVHYYYYYHYNSTSADRNGSNHHNRVEMPETQRRRALLATSSSRPSPSSSSSATTETCKASDSPTGGGSCQALPHKKPRSGGIPLVDGQVMSTATELPRPMRKHPAAVKSAASSKSNNHHSILASMKMSTDSATSIPVARGSTTTESTTMNSHKAKLAMEMMAKSIVATENTAAASSSGSSKASLDSNSNQAAAAAAAAAPSTESAGANELQAADKTTTSTTSSSSTSSWIYAVANETVVQPLGQVLQKSMELFYESSSPSSSQEGSSSATNEGGDGSSSDALRGGEVEGRSEEANNNNNDAPSLLADDDDARSTNVVIPPRKQRKLALGLFALPKVVLRAMVMTIRFAVASNFYYDRFHGNDEKEKNLWS